MLSAALSASGRANQSRIRPGYLPTRPGAGPPAGSSGASTRSWP